MGEEVARPAGSVLTSSGSWSSSDDRDIAAGPTRSNASGRSTSCAAPTSTSTATTAGCTSADDHSDADAYCTSCALRPDDVRHERLREWLETNAASEAS